MLDARHHHSEGRLFVARLLYDAILAVEPTHHDALHGLAVLLVQWGDVKGGLDLIGRAVDRHGMTNDLDRTLARLTRFYLERFVQPTDGLSRRIDVIAPLMPKLRQSPAAYEQLFFHFGGATPKLRREGHYRTAARFAKVATLIEPGRFDILFNLGFFLEADGDFEGAAAAYRHAAAAGDRSQHAHACMMSMHLAFRLGRWSEFKGLLAHKYDYDVVGWWKTHLPVPIWDGTIREGARILINGESGFGDVIQCLRYADYFSQRGMIVHIVCVPGLKALCALGKGVTSALTQGDRLPPVDFRAQSFDLFYTLETDAARCFGSGPYIEIAKSPHRAPTLERRDGDVLIGIKWTTTDATKDLPLALFAKLLLRDGIRLVSLQPEPPDAESGLTVERPLDSYFADPAYAFVSTAWVIDQMDLVVTADSVIAHLAGAVGAKTWVALKPVPDCRWLVDRTDTPFYDSATLFRQAPDEPWSAVFDRMAEALRQRLEAVRPVVQPMARPI
ncbi:hypothetical protein [Azospirillum doebereinerae]|uniref:hypothetical protein n=1 Tax=Azospirillum doebereinerae TaxID=92933 RepID=UPI00163CB616|nr:hypothetical protein [Azospirillum doebereinerae]MCG5238943.1 hypothetical protein [Azospirillum doebereinerae]